jgi:hypothetical protein
MASRWADPFRNNLKNNDFIDGNVCASQAVLCPHGGLPKEIPMSDFRDDPNFVHQEMREYDSRVQWAAVAVMLLLCAGLILAAAWPAGETQTALNGPAAETTGSATTMPPATMPRRP